MRSTSICSCIMIMISNFVIFFICHIFIFKFLFTNTTDFYIFTWFLQLLIFYACKWWYCRHQKTWWNMFAYFCCEWIFRIIFTSINLFYYTFKICINNKWCFIWYLILIKFYYFRVFRRHNYIIKIFIFTYFLCDSSLFFVLQEWRQFKQ